MTFKAFFFFLLSWIRNKKKIKLKFFKLARMLGFVSRAQETALDENLDCLLFFINLSNEIFTNGVDSSLSKWNSFFFLFFFRTIGFARTQSRLVIQFNNLIYAWTFDLWLAFISISISPFERSWSVEKNFHWQRFQVLWYWEGVLWAALFFKLIQKVWNEQKIQRSFHRNQTDKSSSIQCFRQNILIKSFNILRYFGSMETVPWIIFCSRFGAALNPINPKSVSVRFSELF